MNCMEYLMNKFSKIICSAILLSALLTCVGCFNNILFEKQEFKIKSIELQTMNTNRKTNVKYLLNLEGVLDPMVKFEYYTNEEFKVGDVIIFNPGIKN